MSDANRRVHAPSATVLGRVPLYVPHIITDMGISHANGIMSQPMQASWMIVNTNAMSRSVSSFLDTGYCAGCCMTVALTACAYGDCCAYG